MTNKYRCRRCDTFWRKNPPSIAQPMGSWSLWDAAQKPCAVCDNSPAFLSVIQQVSDGACSPGPMYTWWTWKFGMTFTNWVLKFFGRVECDHCHKYVEGFLPDAGGMSAGVYVGWTQYTEFGEYIVCDNCMWTNELYLADYPRPVEAT